MNERSMDLSESEALEASGPVPVNQRPESIAYGVVSLLMASDFVANIVEISQGGMTNVRALGLSTGLAAGATAYNAIQAHRGTVAYNNATEAERNSPRTLDKRYFLRNLRSVSWGGASVVCGEVAVLEVIRAAQSGSTAGSLENIGGALVATGIGKITVSGLRKSLQKQKSLKELVSANQSNKTNEYSLFVSPRYKSQLDSLASALVTPERFS